VDDVVRVLGQEFVRYVLGLNGDSDLPNETSLTTEQQQIIAQLRDILAQLQLPLDESRSSFVLYSALARFGSIAPGTQRSIANILRSHAGGTLEEIPETQDSFERHILALAIETYPVYLLPRPKQGSPTFWSSATLATYEHPSGIEAMRDLLRDGDLRRLFPEAPNAEAINSFTDAVDINAWWTLSSGRGGTYQAIMLVNLILNHAYASLITSRSPTPAQYIEFVQRAIYDVRALARGEVVEVPQLVGLFNLQLDDGITVPVTNGLFRAPSSREREQIFPDGGNVQVVLDTKYPLRLIEVRPWIPNEDPAITFSDEHMRDFEQSRRDSQRRVDNARLALLLASEPDSLISPVEIANIVLDPLNPGGSASWRTEIAAPVPTAMVTGEAAARATAWAETIRRRPAHNLDIGIRRLLSAATARLDPIDGFVDAVVCWENLFGTQMETTFRVTGAMAWLLEPDDATKRDTLQTELKKLYETRSQLVHGSKEPKPLEAVKLRDRAAGLAAESLRRIYLLPELLPLKSDTRSRRILLGRY